MSRAVQDAPVTVLLSLSPPDGTTRYVDQIVGSAAPGDRFLYFGWRTALFGRYDIVHVHWPELMIRAKRPLKARLRRRALDLLIVRARLLRTPIVRTVHNENPHEAGTSSEARSLERLDRATSLMIVLNATTTVAPGMSTVHIPHGHYRDRFPPAPRVDANLRRLLYFGLIRPYKGVEELLSVFTTLRRDDPALCDLELRVVGRPQPAMRKDITQLIDTSENVSGRLEFVPDSDLAAEIAASSLVVLPYRDMHNSGALLVALSLDRPVVVPDTPTTAELADEVGHEWMYRYDGDLTPAVLKSALAWSTTTERRGRPVLDGRDWVAVGRAHSRAYRSALDTTRRRPPRTR